MNGEAVKRNSRKVMDETKWNDCCWKSFEFFSSIAPTLQCILLMLMSFYYGHFLRLTLFNTLSRCVFCLFFHWLAFIPIAKVWQHTTKNRFLVFTQKEKFELFFISLLVWLVFFNSVWTILKRSIRAKRQSHLGLSDEREYMSKVVILLLKTLKESNQIQRTERRVEDTNKMYKK